MPYVNTTYNQEAVMAEVRVQRGRDLVIIATSEQIGLARGWVQDCEWGEDAETISELPAREIVLGVERHYGGGWDQFLADLNM